MPPRHDWTIPMGSQVSVEAKLQRHRKARRAVMGEETYATLEEYERANESHTAASLPFPPCPSCNDLGFQSGAHTEYVVPCPSCRPGCCGDPADCNHPCP